MGLGQSYRKKLSTINEIFLETYTGIALDALLYDRVNRESALLMHCLSFDFVTVGN